MELYKYTGQCSVYFESAKSSQILSLQFFHLEISQQISSLPIVVPLASSSQHICVPANKTTEMGWGQHRHHHQTC